MAGYKFTRLYITNASNPDKKYLFRELTELPRPADLTYELRDIYKFKDEPISVYLDNSANANNESTININFLSNGQAYTSIVFKDIKTMPKMYYRRSKSGSSQDDEVYDFSSSEWKNESFKLLRITSPQQVSVEIFNWIHANAKRQLQLNPPTLSLYLTTLAISSNIAVDEFIISVVSVNGKQQQTMTIPYNPEDDGTTKFNLATLELQPDEYTIYAIARCEGYSNSTPSNGVTYIVEAPEEPITSLANTLWYLKTDWVQPTDPVSTNYFSEPLVYLNTTPVYGFNQQGDELYYYQSASSTDLVKCPSNTSILLSFMNVEAASSFYTNQALINWLKNEDSQLKNLNDTIWKLPKDGWYAAAKYGAFAINGKVNLQPMTEDADGFGFSELNVGYTYDNSLVAAADTLCAKSSATGITMVFNNLDHCYLYIAQSNDNNDSSNPQLMTWLGQYGIIDDTTPKPELITFAIFDTVYYAPAEGTWEDWLKEPTYNTNGFWAYENIVLSQDGQAVLFNKNEVRISDGETQTKIINGGMYTLSEVVTITFYINNDETAAKALPNSRFGDWVANKTYNIFGYTTTQNGYIVKDNWVIIDPDDTEEDYVKEGTYIEKNKVYITKYQELPSQNQGSLTLTWADSATLNNYTVEVQ